MVANATYTYELPFRYPFESSATEAVWKAREIAAKKGYDVFQDNIWLDNDANYRASIEVWVEYPNKLELTSAEIDALRPITETTKSPAEQANRASLISGLALGGAGGAFLALLLVKLFGKKRTVGK